jgi:hypothetical protein
LAKEQAVKEIAEQQKKTLLKRRYLDRWQRYQSWSAGYEGRPVEFIGELIGPAWWGSDWAAWRVFVKTLFGLPLETEELEIYRKCTGLAEYRPYAHREAWMPVGRRGGKSRVMAMIAVYLAVCIDYSKYLAPGEVGFVVVLSDSRDHAAIIMNYVKGALRHRQLESLVRKPLVETVELHNRVTIEIVTASIKAVRSRTVVAALADEIAFWQADETMANPDVEILSGLRPAMATIPDARLVAASSRYARKGALWNAFRDYYAKDEGPLVWSADTQTMHPSIDPDFIAAEYEKDPVSAAAEYGLEWRADVRAFIEADIIEAVTPRDLRELQPDHSTQYYAFVDPSGGQADSFTVAIAHREGDRGILDRAVEHRAPLAPEETVELICAELSRWKVTRVRGDRYAGLWPSEQFIKRGVIYEPSEVSKSDIYREFLPLLTSRRAQLLDITRLRHQLQGLERRIGRGTGREVIDHPPGGQDDLINAAAGALLMAAGDDDMAVLRRYLGVE